MPVSSGLIPLPGSERPRPATHQPLGPLDAGAEVAFTVLVRARAGSSPLPDLAHWQSTPMGNRRLFTQDEFMKTYRADSADLQAVAAYVTGHGMAVLESDEARRSVIVQATAAQVQAAFGVTLYNYQAPLPGPPLRARHPSTPAAATSPAAARTHTHHGYDGTVHLPQQLAGIVTAVIGLDNRCIGVPGGTAGDPTGAQFLAVTTAAKLYNFPNSGAKDQTIGVLSPQMSPGEGGSYLASDITSKYFPDLSDPAYRTPPASINDINIKVGTSTYSNNPTAVQGITASNLNVFPNSWIIEVTQDISTSATIAQGATINVYFTQSSEQGWVAFLQRVLAPQGEKQPTVVTCSFTLFESDDSNSIGSLSQSGSFASVMTGLFQQLAVLGITVFIAQGDWGADDWWTLGPGSPPDGKSHVMYPGSDPWVVSCGGTVLAANPSPAPGFTEYAWGDAWSSSSFGSSTSNFGSTGGGVSATFPAPPYQTEAGISGAKDSAGTFHSGRGVPDIAGMVAFSGSGTSDWFYANGIRYNFIGTSCVAPFYAGYTAMLRSALGLPIGFLNPTLYELSNTAFHDVTVGNNDSRDTPANVKIADPGYTGTTPDAPYFSAGPGWDACTGLGSINGNVMLTALRVRPIFTTPAVGYPGIKIGSAPSLAVFNGRFYCVFQANDSSHNLFVASTSDGTFPPSATGVSGIAIGSAPSLAVFNGRLYCAFQANDSGHDLFVTSTADGASWTTPAKGYPGIKIGSAPSLAVFNGKLYCVFQANDSSHNLFVASTSDGTFPPSATGVSGIAIGSVPSLAVFNGRLCCAFQANDSGHDLFVTSTN
jgi:kumamolisin